METMNNPITTETFIAVMASGTKTAFKIQLEQFAKLVKQAEEAFKTTPDTMTGLWGAHLLAEAQHLNNLAQKTQALEETVMSISQDSSSK
jgi:hypothetical protein